MSQELRIAITRLEAISRAARQLADHLPDLYSLAYEPADLGDDIVVSATPGPHYLDAVGNQLARHLWHQLIPELAKADARIEGLRNSVLNLMMAGPSPPKSKGSLISSAEHQYQLDKQTQRRAADDPLASDPPARLEDQPKHIGAKGGRR